MSNTQPPKLADQLRAAIRLRGYSYRTEQAYVQWYVRFVRFHKLRHPREMGQPEVAAFLTHLVTDLEVSASTQNQALAALLFLYAEVLKKPLGDVDALHAKKTHYVQPYLSAAEVHCILDHLGGVAYLAAGLMYGGGLRLMECVRLRVKDVDFANLTLTIHDAKSNHDRVTFLPADEIFLTGFALTSLRCAAAMKLIPISRFPCPRLSRGNIARPPLRGNGSTFSRHAHRPLTRLPARLPYITWMNRTFSGRLPRPSSARASING